MATTTEVITYHAAAVVLYVDDTYRVLCTCGWKAEMPAKFVHRAKSYEERLKRMGYTQHQQTMRGK